jgi:2-dehydropantoate 2-reductase
MRILVVGAGALGGLVGAQLTEAGEDVLLVEVNPARTKLLNETGLNISEVGRGERCVRIHVVTAVEGTLPVDLVIVAVKSYQTRAAIESIQPAIDSKTLVLSLQNGIGNTETLAEVLGPERVLCGITYHSIQHVGPNRIRFRPGIKPIQISPFQGELTPEIRALGETLREGGLNIDVVENIDHVIWQKLLHNAVVNPVSALTGLTCRELLDDEHCQAFMRELCREIIAVMRARGIPIIDEEDPYRPVINSQKALAKNRPSMWQDLARGNCTEVDAINGAIVEEAKRLGLDAPHNRALVQFIHSRERQKILKKQEIARTLRAAAAAAASPSARPLPRARAHATVMDPEGGMSSGRVPLQTAPKLKELLHEYHRDLQAAADDPDRQVAWCSGLGPVEIVRALGMTPFFPENHAALIGTSRQTGKYIPRALGEGFSQFASSAMTSDIGAMIAGDSPLVSVHGIEGPPRPDVLVYNTNNGFAVTRWFQYYANHFQVPVLGLHPPKGLPELSYVEVDAAVQQMLHLISGLEKTADRRLDFDRLAEVVDYSARAAGLWGEILNLARTVPSPLTYFDMLVHMAPMVVMRGTPQAVEYYEILKAELEDRVANQLAAVPGERFRFYWEGPPIWCALRPLAELFLRERTAIVAATYSQVFAIDRLDRNNPIASMAQAYTGTFLNRSDDFKASFLKSQFDEFGVDAVVYHEGRTAPEQSNVRYGLEVRLRRETGLPSIVLEADTHDLRLFSINQIRRQLEEFIEQQEDATVVPPDDAAAEVTPGLNRGART